MSKLLFTLVLFTTLSHHSYALKPGDYSVRTQNPNTVNYIFCIDSTEGSNVDTYKNIWCSTTEKYTGSDEVSQIKAAMDLKFRLYRQHGKVPPLPEKEIRGLNSYNHYLDSDFNKNVMPKISKEELLSIAIDNKSLYETCRDREMDGFKIEQTPRKAPLR